MIVKADFRIFGLCYYIDTSIGSFLIIILSEIYLKALDFLIFYRHFSYLK